MNKKMYSVYALSVILLAQESIIGKRMMVQDNSYIVTKQDKEAKGALYGKIVEITSEPFEEDIEGICNHIHTETFVYAVSLESGIEYRVLWNENWLVDADEIIPKTDVRGRMIVLSDGSYSKEIGGNGKLWGIDKAKMVIVSNPYIRDCTERNDTKKWKYVFVDAYNLKDGKIYSVLFNEKDLVDEVNVTIEIQVELS